MSKTEEALDLLELLTADETSLEQFWDLRRYVNSHIERRSELERSLADWKMLTKKFSTEAKAELRRGVALWLLGRSEEAIPVLQESRASKEQAYFLGVCCLEAGRNATARESLKEAVSADSSDLQVQLAYVEALIKCNEMEPARASLDRLLKKHEDSAGLHYVDGLWYDAQGSWDDAMEAYDKALAQDPGHAPTLFRFAYLHDLHGEESAAMEFYEQLRTMRPVHISTMINLGVLYEDRGEYEKAADCYRRILDYYPNHSRAKLFFSDAQSAMNMYYDEDAARRQLKLSAMLTQPVVDMSFSPRVRKALERLEVQTVGDLCKMTEEDFLTVPNFGKTSLRELKEFLATKGLGLNLGEGGTAAVTGVAAQPQNEQILTRPLSDFEWTGRVPRIFETLGLKTFGDLVQKTETDLLEVKSVGSASIQEVRKRLASLGLALKG